MKVAHSSDENGKQMSLFATLKKKMQFFSKTWNLM